MNQNIVILVGRLTKDPEFHPAGRKGEPHATFVLAINEVVPDERGPRASYIPVSVWGEQATALCEEKKSGDTVGVRGRVRTAFVEDPGGGSRPFWEVRAEEIWGGMQSLKNLQAPPETTQITRQVERLAAEF